MSKKQTIKKALTVVTSLAVVIAISICSAVIIHDKRSKNAVTTSVENGLSAYELAVQYGYEGTVQEWLNSLNGKSAYEIAQDNGYSGSESDWANTLKATAGKDGVGIKTATFNADGQLVITLSDNTAINLGNAVGANGKDGVNGTNGTNGQDGKDGTNGKDGNDGVSITTANINDDGQLVIAFSNGESVNLDKVVGTNGQDGISVTDASINTEGELVITLSDGNVSNLGVVVGKDGQNGKDGVNGKDGEKGDTGAKGDKGDKSETGVNGQDGISVTNASINTEGELVLTYSNGQKDNLGNVIGAKGDKGDQGEKGEQGIQGEKGETGADGKDGTNGVDGKDGVSVTKSEINQRGELVITLSNGNVSNLGVVVGKDGINGTNGQDGAKGEKGDTGAKGDKGDIGTNGQDGAKGDKGDKGDDGVGISLITVTNGNLSITLTSGTTLELGNIKGSDGVDGRDGADGTNGQDGIGVKSTEINQSGELVITYSNDNSVNLGKVTGTNGTNGQDGNGITKTEINANGELVITYSNGTTENLGVVVGKDGVNGINGQDGAKGEKGDQGIQGEKGEKGDKGDTGVGVSSVTVDENNHLLITLSDNPNQPIDLGNVKGEKGDKGDKGDTGANGTDGQNGQDGVGIDSVKIENGILLIKYTNTTDYTTIGNIKGDDGVGIAEVYVTDGYIYVRKTNETTATQLAYIKGEKGDTGAKGDNGNDGTNGVDGKSAYELYCEAHPEYTGTMDEWLTSLKGEKGDTGAKGETGKGIQKTELINGELWVTYTDGNSENLGSVSDQTQNLVSGLPEYYFAFDLLSGETSEYAIALNPQFKDTITSLTIPSEYKGIPITRLGFNDRTYKLSSSNMGTSLSGSQITYSCASSSLKEITIPKSVTYINDHVFYQSALEKAYFENTSGWYRTSYANSNSTATVAITEETMKNPEEVAELLKDGYRFEYLGN